MEASPPDARTRTHAPVTAPAFAWVLAAIAALLGGCSTYFSGYRFEPSPGEAAIDLDGTRATPDARVLATVVGIRRELPEPYAFLGDEAVDADEADADSPKVRGLDLRVRVENLGEAPLTFDPRETSVVTAMLDELPEPLLAPGPTDIAPGEAVTVNLTYPLPLAIRGPDDVGDVNIRVGVTLGDRFASGGIGFDQKRVTPQRTRSVVIASPGFNSFNKFGVYRRSRFLH